MNVIKIWLGLGLAFGLSACAMSEPASRSYGPEGLTIAAQGGPIPRTVPDLPHVGAARMSGYAVQDVQVIVPRTLKVSEANSFKPRADIVWHGDPDGDRYTQVTAIVDAAARLATAGMTQGRAVEVTVSMVKFHALTVKTRRSIGGMHDLRFDLTVRDAVSGEVLDGPRLIVAHIKASGGAAAKAEEAAGRTQKVVITERIVEVLRRELSVPLAAPVLIAGYAPFGQETLLR